MSGNRGKSMSDGLLGRHPLGQIVAKPPFWLMLLLVAIVLYFVIPTPAWPLIIFALLAAFFLTFLLRNK